MIQLLAGAFLCCAGALRFLPAAPQTLLCEAGPEQERQWVASAGRVMAQHQQHAATLACKLVKELHGDVVEVRKWRSLVALSDRGWQAFLNQAHACMHHASRRWRATLCPRACRRYQRSCAAPSCRPPRCGAATQGQAGAWALSWGGSFSKLPSACATFRLLFSPRQFVAAGAPSAAGAAAAELRLVVHAPRGGGHQECAAAVPPV